MFNYKGCEKMVRKMLKYFINKICGSRYRYYMSCKLPKNIKRY